MKIRSCRKITDLKWLNLFTIEYEDESGRLREWQIASRNPYPKHLCGEEDRPDAVIIVPYHIEKKRLVFIKEFRVAINGFELGFPAGLIDPGESIEEAAERELAEETGLELAETILISPPLYSSAGMTDESVVVLFGECKGDLITSVRLGSERILPFFATPAEAIEIAQRENLMFDAKSWLVLLGHHDPFSDRPFEP